MNTSLRTATALGFAAALAVAVAMPLPVVNAGQVAGSVLDGVFTTAQAARGRQRFQQECSACHTVGEHTGRKFGARWQGSTMGDLFALVSATMPEGNPGGLEPADYAAILAFFLSESGYKAGDAELASEVEPLARIRIEPLPQQ